jgi:8-oxo-dGTP pyrophosphatase MutT (NUDIX family)
MRSPAVSEFHLDSSSTSGTHSKAEVSDMAQDGVVRAAGGVVSRRNERGEVELLLVHRPHHGDWSFPKGKPEPGETDEQCALRKVWEETGLRCALGSELPAVSYRDGRGRAKTVLCWTMTADGDAEARNESDAVRWLGIPAAASLLSYWGDRGLLAAFSAR